MIYARSKKEEPPRSVRTSPPLALDADAGTPSSPSLFVESPEPRHDTFISYDFTPAEVEALLCNRAVCDQHIQDRITAERKLRRGLEHG